MSRSTRSCILFLATAMAVLAFAAPALAVPRATFVKYSNPIAYQLKSLQTTRFYTNVDTGNVWAELKVATPYGDRFIYKGPIAAAGKNFFFPLWNGTGPHGENLPSSAGYQWTLTVSQSGLSSATRGTIAVTKIYMGTHVKATAADLLSHDLEVRRSAYLITGSFNIYVSAFSSAPSTWTPNPGAIDIFVETGNTAGSSSGSISTSRGFVLESPLAVGKSIRFTGHGGGTLGILGNRVHAFEIDTNQPSDITFTLIQ